MGRNKASCPDGITMTILRNLKEELSPSISLIVNRSILDGEFPTSWNQATVIPIPKAPTSNKPEEYRPIALLPLVSKLAKQYYLQVLYPIVNIKLNQNQFGFRHHRSTTDTLLCFENNVTAGFDLCRKNGKSTKVSSLFFDIRKAFNTVPPPRESYRTPGQETETEKGGSEHLTVATFSTLLVIILDLNPLDYAVWSILEEKECAKPHTPVESLKRTLVKAWDEITVETLAKIVNNFPKRLKACIEANGGHFK
uniref:Reverse transcriptase domain-containing protein n=1 Tax=Acrobeloides nanus TaxID=290746 RepID=A0A914DEH2_9BILA